MTDKPMIERPPLEAIREHFRDAPIVVVIDYALSIEAELARHKRYRERTRGMVDDDDYAMSVHTDDIAKEEGIE